MNIIGIDPGKNGAIVVLSNDGKILFRETMPCIGNEFNILSLQITMRDIVKKFGEHVNVFIEDVHAIFGSAAGSTFQFGYVVGITRAMVVAFNLSYTMVQPKKWQKEIYQGIPEIRKPSIVVKTGKHKGQIRKGALDTKKMSELAAQRLFPSANLKRTDKCTINHDGIIDALLISEYGRRIMK